MSGSATGVQTVRRALDLLEHIADEGEAIAVSNLAAMADLPVPTVYRLLRTLVSLGYVRQLPSRRYTLGARLIRLGETAGRMLGDAATPFLGDLVRRTGETSNFAMLDGDMVVYVAQVPSKHSMRMFTEIGRRVLPHCTGVGKAILSQMPDDRVREIVARTGMPARTSRTLTTPDALLADLAEIRRRGWSHDDEEQEVGVRCIAVALPGSDIPAAVSVSGPNARITEEVATQLAPFVMTAAADLAETLRPAAAGADDA